MRTAHGIYRTLQEYLAEMDKHGFDEDIDMDFRSVSRLQRFSGIMRSLTEGWVGCATWDRYKLAHA